MFSSTASLSSGRAMPSPLMAALSVPPHGRVAAAGSATVFINGMPVVRVGDAIDCGGVAATGSSNVFIGDLS